jgi:hypothetical protein
MLDSTRFPHHIIRIQVIYSLNFPSFSVTNNTDKPTWHIWSNICCLTNVYSWTLSSYNLQANPKKSCIFFASKWLGCIISVITGTDPVVGFNSLILNIPRVGGTLRINLKWSLIAWSGDFGYTSEIVYTQEKAVSGDIHAETFKLFFKRTLTSQVFFNCGSGKKKTLPVPLKFHPFITL